MIISAKILNNKGRKIVEVKNHNLEPNLEIAQKCGKLKKLMQVITKLKINKLNLDQNRNLHKSIQSQKTMNSIKKLLLLW